MSRASIISLPTSCFMVEQGIRLAQIDSHMLFVVFPFGIPLSSMALRQTVYKDTIQ
jgi:hypothetical protein